MQIWWLLALSSFVHSCCLWKRNPKIFLEYAKVLISWLLAQAQLHLSLCTILHSRDSTLFWCFSSHRPSAQLPAILSTHHNPANPSEHSPTQKVRCCSWVEIPALGAQASANRTTSLCLKCALAHSKHLIHDVPWMNGWMSRVSE